MKILLFVVSWPFLVVGTWLLLAWLLSALCAGNGRD